MTDHQSQIDRRPFRSKADQQQDLALQTQYHSLGIPAVVAALQIRDAQTPAVTEKQAG